MGELAVLWHLHQPEYRDPATGVPVMPWTRLHALRGYTDLFAETLAHDPPWTVNVVPVLLEQLDDAAAGVEDAHLALSRRPVDTLDDAERAWVRATFVAGHPTMRQPWASLAAVVEQGGAASDAALRDVIVWSTLQWFGATALAEHPELRALRAKGRGFTEDDKAVMLAAHDAVVRALPGRIAAAGRLARARLSTTPVHHPILPLLIDTDHARRCLPGAPLGVGYAFPEDAGLELQEARAALEARTGRAPAGLWPSEGAVSPEVVPWVARAGFRWLATDEGILRRSEVSSALRSGPVPAGPWALGHGVVGFFRDTDLSDRVGFRYATWPADEAVADLVRALRGRDALTLLALDGENPWESYPDAGAGFRAALRGALTGAAAPGVTLDDAAARAPVGRVERLHTGSWIGGDLAIWFGHPHDHAAWRMLARARAAAEGHPRQAAAMPHLRAAMGSDWTWWYGEDFATPFSAHFDATFRRHIAAAWQALGLAVPQDVLKPIGNHVGAPGDAEPPKALLSVSEAAPFSWAGWRGAGHVRPSRSGAAGGAMGQGVAPPAMHYGLDAEGALWLRWAATSSPPPVTVYVGEVAVEVGAEGGVGPGLRAWRGSEGMVVRARAPGPVRRSDGWGPVTPTLPSVDAALAYWEV